jgi:hypothetical protein
MIQCGVVNALVSCEFSAIVRDELRALGINAWSCDKEPCEGDPQWHIQDDVRGYLHLGWDMMIAHPPCKYLSLSSLRWMYLGGKKIVDAFGVPNWDYDRCEAMHQGAEFYNLHVRAPIPLIAVENPRMHPYAITECGEPDQYVQLWQFGDAETKEHGFKLKRLPKLMPTEIVPVSERKALTHKASPGPLRWKYRSRTQPGIGKAMAQQWGRYALAYNGYAIAHHEIVI